MPVLATDELKERIQSLPTDLRKALERQARAKIEIARLEAQIEKLQAQIDKDDNSNEDDEDSSSNVSLEDDLELLRLESAVKHLKLELSEAEDKAEIEIRRSAGKVTEAHVKAAVGIDPNVCQLKHALLDAEDAARERKITLQRERQLAREARLEARYSREPVIEPENPEMEALESKLAKVQEELTLADLEVQVIRTTIDAYKMLVQLEH